MAKTSTSQVLIVCAVLIFILVFREFSGIPNGPSASEVGKQNDNWKNLWRSLDNIRQSISNHTQTASEVGKQNDNLKKMWRSLDSLRQSTSNHHQTNEVQIKQILQRVTANTSKAEEQPTSPQDIDDKFKDVRSYKLPFRTSCWAPDEYAKRSELSITPDYVAHLQTLGPISKKIFIVWEAKGAAKDIWSFKDVPMVKYGVLQLKEMNPDWEFHVYNLEMMNGYIKSKLAPSDWEMLKDSGIVTKTDIFRLLAMYYEGGLYQDVDRLYNIPMSKVLSNETKILLPFLYDVTFQSDFLCTAPKNLVFKRAIEIYLCKMREQNGEGLLQWEKLNGEQRHIVTTEAMGTFYASVMETLFGRPIWGPINHEENGDQGRAFADRVRELINSTAYMKTYREEWCHMMTVEHPNCQNITKKELFNQAKVRQWDT